MENKRIILAIDDNAVQLRLFKEMLVPRYDLRAVKAASEALNFLNSNEVDLILLDIEMPNISGFEFLDDIRKIPSYISVPIIIVSGNNTEEFLNRARKSSAADVLTKPVNPNVLVSTIEKTLTLKT
ncbi:MAG: response regulator [Treponema sp.]|jgi:CheY-like chemotaxis protein|nr:response regulator [Treponema sp.]